MKRKQLLFVLTFLLSMVQGVWADGLSLSGTGEEGDPYIIGSSDDWDALATEVNSNKQSFAGKYFQLGENITVTTMLGIQNQIKFAGNFDGKGKTLTLSYGTSDSPFTEKYCAPFRHVEGVTIKDLHVVGTIYTKNKFAAGLIGAAWGSCTITNCQVSVEINSFVNGDGTHGGIVALTETDSNVSFNGCWFDGKLIGENTYFWGGFVGYAKNDVTLTNCLFCPQEVSISGSRASDTFSRTAKEADDPVVDTSYFSYDLGGRNQGVQVHITETTGIDVVEEVTAANGMTYYAYDLLTLNNADNSIALSSGKNEEHNILLNGFTLYKDGCWNTLCLPFTVTISGSIFEGAEVKELNTVTFADGTLILTFRNVTSITAGKTYFVKWESGENIVNPLFKGVTITKTNGDQTTKGNVVTIKGTVSPVTFSDENKTVLLLQGENTWCYPDGKSETKINAFHAYMMLSEGYQVGTSSAGAKAVQTIEMNFNDLIDDGIATGIKSMENGIVRDGQDSWYTIDGWKLSSKPTVKGIYVLKGRKVIIH